MSFLGYFHTACGACAVGLGLAIFLARKGTPTHIWVGRAYVASMVAVNGTALLLYNLTGSFNIFHVLAIISLVTVLAGWFQALNRKRFRRWLWRHYQYMAWSYVGLLAATCNEAFVRIPPLVHLTEQTTRALPMITMLTIVALSGVFIFTKQRTVLARYGPR